jgi:hypothetical protein
MMKRLLLLPVAVLALAAALSSQALAQTTGPASTYIISVTSIELCSSSACSGSHLLGSGSKNFDIASAAVGGAIGAYAGTSGMPIGRTFTHLRTQMSRTIQIAGSTADPGGVGAVCNTDGTPGATTGGAVLTGGGALAISNLVVPDILAIGGAGPTAGEYSAQGISLVDATTFQFLTTLTSPITVGTTPPNIDIAFQTQNAVGAIDAGGGNCEMFPQPPVVTLTIN